LSKIFLPGSGIDPEPARAYGIGADGGTGLTGFKGECHACQSSSGHFKKRSSLNLIILHCNSSRSKWVDV
jgi:hypothetical protein